MQILYILIVILFLGLFIITHELGHFLTAKWFGVKVNEFSVGMGPLVLKKKDASGTQYSLRALPIGGFCALEGETEDSDDPASLYKQSAIKKIIIFAAGSLMNLLFAAILLIIIAFNTKEYSLPVFQDFMDGVPFESEDGLLPGDRVLAINGHAIWRSTDIGEILAREESPYEIKLERNGEIITNTVDLYKSNYFHDGEWNEGYYGFIYEKLENPTIMQKIDMTAKEAADLTRIIIWSLQDLFTGNINPTDLTGLIGIVDVASSAGMEIQDEYEATIEELEPDTEISISESFLYGFMTILNFMALVGINLAVMNLLPIPALDGGHILFVLINAILAAFKLKTITLRQEQIAHAMAMFFLCGLMVFLLVNDVFRIIMKI